MYVINTLAPVFLVIILGTVLIKSKFLSPQLVRENDRLVYWVGLPCLLFNKTATATIAGGSALKIAGVLTGGGMGCVILAYLLSRLLGISSKLEGAFVQAAFRGNLAYVGLPVVSYALDRFSGSSAIATMNAEQLQSLAVLSFAPLVPLYNATAVFVLIKGNSSKHDSWRTILRSTFTNPLLTACGLGLLLAIVGISLPLWLSKTTQTIGQMSLPLALLGIGASLAKTKISGRIGLSALATVLKVFAAPLIGVFIANWLNLTAPERTIALLYLACPTAIASYIMAGQLGGDEALTSSSIVLSTMCSAIALAIVLSLS
ncbi:AEC family transporter [Myxosarcina sp. GI1]|uniref:AEC family transporter n=1 Tax=Myxosarcina sp. GI1 TaxID=1541065 RepID=UPI00056CA525|nr:AEC family transporter [Myxosarcina sp. GI1]